MSLSPKDLDFIEAKNAAAREIALAMGVPPMLLGIPGDNTYSNFQGANRALWRQTILPLVTRTAKAITAWLAPGEGLELRPDLDAIEALSSEREALWARLEAASFLTANEKRAAAGYGEIDDEALAAKAGFNTSQPRDDHGRWTGDGGAIPVAGRRRGNSLYFAPGQQLALQNAQSRAAALTARVHERDPGWKPPPSYTSPTSAESVIRHYETTARAAEARLAELARTGIGHNSGATPGTSGFEPLFNTSRPTDGPAIIRAYRSIMPPDYSDRTAVVAVAVVDGTPYFGTNSGSPVYTSADYEAAYQMRETLLRNRLIRDTPNVGSIPNDALFHAEFTAILRVARQSRDTLVGRELELHIDRRPCPSCRELFPILARELRLSSIRTLDRDGNVRLFRPTPGN